MGVLCWPHNVVNGSKGESAWVLGAVLFTDRRYWYIIWHMHNYGRLMVRYSNYSMFGYFGHGQ